MQNEICMNIHCDKDAVYVVTFPSRMATTVCEEHLETIDKELAEIHLINEER